MIDEDARHDEARRWARREVQKRAGRGMAADGRLLAEVMRAAADRPGRHADDPWAEETALAVIRRTAQSLIDRRPRARPRPARRQGSPAVLLVGGALLAVLLDLPRSARAA